ncbi:right-handed parallel beta-helix repeat-containing protein [Bacillus solimangrovi]|uniref:Right handed beta helix domain-containing protein n=1 Tax=Bacillus solimangrovi TaxID=1305675 RepID=A0A1E5LI30_9BACI|nr:right-handed parallel beta-helix repeat-containing protein [Bacillus solimangrovi]OEH93749.1 hypothetical protein BFG57_11225 [Bacillus solimangrovi]
MSLIVVPTDAATVQDAITAANEGDSIQILAGTFDGFDVTKERLKIFGCGVGKTIISGVPGSGNDGVVLNADQTILERFTVQGFPEIGIRVNSNNNVLNQLESNFNGTDGFSFLGFAGGDHNLIIQCNASFNEQDGLATGFQAANNCMIRCNSFQNKDDGFDISTTNNKFISNVTKGNSTNGLALSSSGDSMNILFNNSLLKNGSDGISNPTGPFNNIIENLVCNNGNSGIFVQNDFSVIDSNIIRNNGMSGTGSGILVSDTFAQNNTIRFNKLKNNTPNDIEAPPPANTNNTFDGNKCENSLPPGLCT